MGLQKGQKLKEITKTQRFELRMTDNEVAKLDHCSKELHLSRAQILLAGLELVNKSLTREV